MKSPQCRITALAGIMLLLRSLTAAIPLDINDTESIKQAAANAAYGLVVYYNGNDTGGTPGVLPYPPYYWWESGGFMNSLVNYWYYTGDDTYVELTQSGITWQAGPGNAFLPPNQTFDEGVDDQVFWAFTSMAAAEYNFPNPPANQPQWLELSQGVFNSLVARWDLATCGGGLRWQFNELNSGYYLKTSACNAGFFNLAARLGAYTGNQTYITWALKAWDWMVAVNMINPQLVLFDNTNTGNNCTTMDEDHWTYTTGILLNGAAVMWNQTQDALWQNRTLQIWQSAVPLFFVAPKTGGPAMIMRDQCEPTSQCNINEVSFKAYLSRFMAASTKVAPWLYPYFKPYLAASAVAAAAQCGGGSNSSLCGYHWYWETDWDGTSGVGQQMAALEVIQANLIDQVAAPVGQTTGGTSHGNNAAGTNLGPQVDGGVQFGPVTTASKAGAGLLTGLLCLVTLIGAWWLIDNPIPSTRSVRFANSS